MVGPGGLSTLYCALGEEGGRPTFVRGGDGIVPVIGGLCTANNMSPHDAHLVPGVDIDDGCGHGGPEAAVAGEIGIVHVLDGVVGVGCPDAYQQPLVLKADERKGRVEAGVIRTAPLTRTR